jgi:hypothetical protein
MILHISQPLPTCWLYGRRVLSRSVAMLGDMLGVRLINRSTCSVSLTDAGRK